jgi:acylphosphatase
MSEAPVRARLTATALGRVQGVFFRAFVERRAAELGLAGYVRNLPGGGLEVQAEGERDSLEKLAFYLRTEPPRARVDRVETVWQDYTGDFAGFEVRY